MKHCKVTKGIEITNAESAHFVIQKLNNDNYIIL